MNQHILRSKSDAAPADVFDTEVTIGGDSLQVPTGTGAAADATGASAAFTTSPPVINRDQQSDTQNGRDSSDV